ncbi:MAG TPA: hypothetical protein VE999_10840 [Gemmataceae bacterium]|nr:hypothetical protein [Gemmataceae bacterium]
MTPSDSLPTDLAGAHTSIFGYVNALIFRRNFFRSRGAIRTANRQKFLVLFFKRKSRDSNSTRFQRLSTTTGRFFASSIAQRVVRSARKIPSPLITSPVVAANFLRTDTVVTPRFNKLASVAAFHIRQGLPASAVRASRTR